MERSFVMLAIAGLTVSTTLFASPEWSGDLRYRVERTDQEGRDARLRHRIRARVAAKGEIAADTSYELRVVSGDDSPTSSNQTLTNGFSTKSLMLDRARITWDRENLPALTAGKFSTPFYRPGDAGLLWDSDLSMEGLAITEKYGDFFVSLGYLFTQERGNAPDSALQGAEVGLKWGDFIFGTGIFDYQNLESQAALYDSTEAFGNTTIASGSDVLYAKAFSVAHVFAEYNVSAMNVLLFGEFARNIATSTKNDAWIVGAGYDGDFELKYSYRKLEADSTVGVFADSDFAGGGTDVKGHEIIAGFKPAKGHKIYAAQFINKTAVNHGQDYYKTQLNWAIKF